MFKSDHIFLFVLGMVILGIASAWPSRRRAGPCPRLRVGTTADRCRGQRLEH